MAGPGPGAEAPSQWPNRATATDRQQGIGVDLLERRQRAASGQHDVDEEGAASGGAGAAETAVGVLYRHRDRRRV